MGEEYAILTDWAFDCYRNGKLDDLVEGDMEAIDKVSEPNGFKFKFKTIPIPSIFPSVFEFVDVKTPPKMIEQDGKEINNPYFLMWKNNDGLLTTWLRSMMNEDVLSMVIGLQKTREIWLTVEENMLPATKEQEWLKDSLYSLKK
ncbi:hypothetical protein WN943_009495 [Citrus x changshan-huyou]